MAGLRTGAGRELKPRLGAVNRPSSEGSTSISRASGSAQRQFQPLRLVPFMRDLAVVVQDLDSSSEGSGVLADVSLVATIRAAWPGLDAKFTRGSR